MYMVTSENLLLVMSVVVLLLGIVVAVMLWQSRRHRQLLRCCEEIIEREQHEVDRTYLSFVSTLDRYTRAYDKQVLAPLAPQI